MTNKKKILFYADKDVENILNIVKKNTRSKFINKAIRIYSLLKYEKYSDLEIISEGIKALKAKDRIKRT